MQVPFVDLKSQYRSISGEVRSAMDEVLESAEYILGSAVDRFESAFAEFVGTRYAVGVGSGLDALRIGLEACGVRAGDDVIVPANTYIATALAVSAVGARPVLVDCTPDTYEIDPDALARSVTPRTKAVIPVHLYGQSADMESVRAVADSHGLQVVEDAAQAHGTRYDDERCGAMGRLGCFSFYPGKNLGAYGDGGIITTDDPDVAERARRIRNYGQARKYDHRERGTNSRLDSVQAAVLGVKLSRLEAWNEARARHAARYNELLAGSEVAAPPTDPRSTHVYHLYVVRAPRRDGLAAYLAERGIQTGIHYPIPIHLQHAYVDLGYGPGSFPVTERLAGEILSLPMFPELTDAQIEYVADAVRGFYGGR